MRLEFKGMWDKQALPDSKESSGVQASRALQEIRAKQALPDSKESLGAQALRALQEIWAKQALPDSKESLGDRKGGV